MLLFLRQSGASRILNYLSQVEKFKSLVCEMVRGEKKKEIQTDIYPVPRFYLGWVICVTDPVVLACWLVLAGFLLASGAVRSNLIRVCVTDNARPAG